MVRNRTLDADLLTTASFFTLSMSAWRNHAKGSLSGVQVNADKTRLKLSKKLIVSPEYDAIRRYMEETKGYLMARCMPSFMRAGIYIVALSQVKEFEKKLADASRRLEKLVDAFLDVYGRQVDAARAALNDQFDEANYPPARELAVRFAFNWQWMYFGVPENLPKEIRAKEAAKLEKAYAEARTEIIAALREGFAELVDHVVDRLKPSADGKPKVFRDTLVENFREFFDTFDAKNLMNDEELAGVVEKAKEIMAGVDPKRLRDEKKLRAIVIGGMNKVKTLTDQLVAEAPRRKFAMDDEF